MLHRALAVLLATLGLSGCLHRVPPAPPPAVAHPHYLIGAPYQADGHWFYPAEDQGLDLTGIAGVQDAQAQGQVAGLTADGELRDPGALTGAMQTVQLPVIVEVTNLENGRQIRVRVNDRGPASVGRVIAVSPRAALLLGMAGPTRVRVRLDQAMSRALADELGGGKLGIATAPAGEVTEEALGPPGTGAAGPARVRGAAAVQAGGMVVPERLPEQVRATYPDPGRLMLLAGAFGRAGYANAVAARLSGLGADVVRSRDGRQTRYKVQAGPFATIAQADAALAAALRAGVIDAHLSIE